MAALSKINNIVFVLISLILLPTGTLHAEDVVSKTPLRIVVKGFGPQGWLPTSDEIAALELELPDEFANASKLISHYQEVRWPLEKYGRRYAGEIQPKLKTKFIDVFGFCSMSLFTEEQIRNGAGVDDGGSCYFSGMFDPATKKFFHFYFNGRG
jgi:hypothetical protein